MPLLLSKVITTTLESGGNSPRLSALFLPLPFGCREDVSQQQLGRHASEPAGHGAERLRDSRHALGVYVADDASRRHVDARIDHRRSRGDYVAAKEACPADADHDDLG